MLMLLLLLLWCAAMPSGDAAAGGRQQCGGGRCGRRLHCASYGREIGVQWVGEGCGPETRSVLELVAQ